MTTKHTPGPWRLHKKHARFSPIITTCEDDTRLVRIVADVSDRDSRFMPGEAMANAALIAAAPDLLEALRNAIFNLEAAANDFERLGEGETGEYIRSFVDTHRAALAKAQPKATP